MRQLRPAIARWLAIAAGAPMTRTDGAPVIFPRQPLGVR
jgi:hypothetical protein